MKNISFTKMSGAGNDFILIDGDDNSEFLVSEQTVQKLCDRHNGIGADGVILISSSQQYDFVMNYCNADGSTGSLCGNGARCAIKFAFNTKRIKDKSTRFLSNNSEYTGEILEDGMIRFNLKSPSNLRKNIQLNAAGKDFTVHFINTGSPHVVIMVEDLDNTPVEKIGKEIRWLAEFAPDGTNVNFVKIEHEDVHIRTYERGVESETLACGTGSVAAAIICNKTDEINAPVTILTRSKAKLFVNFNVINDEFSNVSLTGPVSEIFKGQFQINLVE
ncbi:MAG: diaminopimelate epimerase [Ignavibacteriaceae bacterium]|nr:diaminopimelate epimerase [Ignavibacteriaceae bacterium]